MEKELRKKYYNLCDPYKVLPLDSGNIIDIDNFEVNDKKIMVRGKVWAEEIANKISWSDESQVVYFTGYAGSGKTTELRRVMNLLEKEDVNLLPIYINSLDYLDKHSKIELVDIFSVIVYNVTKDVAKYMGKDEDSAFDDSAYFTKLWNWLVDTDVELKSVSVGANPIKLVFEMKDRPDFRKRVKASINTDITNFKNNVLVELNRLNNLVKSYEKDKKRKDGIVLIVDGLEHNRGIGESIDVVAQASEALFKNRDNLTLPFHTIYTIPAYLSTRHISEIFFLPVIRVIQKDNTKFEKGIEVMKALVYGRIPESDVDNFISKELLEKVILFSGGYPRDFLKMLQKLLMVKEFPVKEKDVESIFMDLENEYKEFVPEEFKSKLLKIDETKSLNLSESEHREVAYELFSIHAILRYRNGNLWWGLHPALKRVLNITDNE